MVNAARPRVPVLVGPTASGKSAVALHLALLLEGEIVSADARQVYRELDIGTAKPTPEERVKVPHHCVDLFPPDRAFSAGVYGPMARGILLSILARGKIPVVVGGSGLYIRALIDGLFDSPAADPDIRRSLEAAVAAGDLPHLVAELREADPETAARIDTRNPRRVIRALEVFRATGTQMSALRRTARVEIPFAPALFGIRWSREELYRRIEQRCEQMVARGLIDEAARLLRKGYSPALPSLATVGYAEAFAHLQGRTSGEEMLRLFKQNSRRYAKRQITWFNADRRIRWVEMVPGRSEAEAAAEIRDAYLSLLQTREETQ